MYFSFTPPGEHTAGGCADGEHIRAAAQRAGYAHNLKSQIVQVVSPKPAREPETPPTSEFGFNLIYYTHM